MKEYGDKEQRILDTAADLFARQPFHKVLLSDVARVASVGKGTLYLYFKSKEDLYFAVPVPRVLHPGGPHARLVWTRVGTPRRNR